jgi:hypothetical protein
MVISLGIGTSIEFFTEEFHTLNLKDIMMIGREIQCVNLVIILAKLVLFFLQTNV